jgi:hypothetical protein
MKGSALTATTAVPTAPARDGFLRFAMRLDAGLSGLAGIGNAAFAAQIAEMSGTTTAMEYAMGAFLVVYGVTVFLLSMLPSVRTAGIGVIAANLLYALASVVAVISGAVPLTTTGIVLTLATGVYTLVMADLQYVGLRRMRT